ncbi:MAG: type IV pilus modification PilV family protein [Deltaproteobacteria bacterium]
MKRHGFTLIEVTVALAILALGLVAVVDINAGATRLHEASEQLTLATLLARGKMIDLEQKLNQDGFSDFDKEIDGTFEVEKHPEVRWKAEILKPDLSKSTDQLTSLITGAMGAHGATSGSSGGAGGTSPLASLLGQSSLMPPPGSPLPGALGAPDPSQSSSAAPSPTTTGLGGILGQAATGLIQTQVQGLVQQIQQGVREVRLTILWKDGKLDDSFTVTTHLVVLQPTGPGTSAVGAAPPGQSTNPNGSGVPGQLGGMPGAMPGMLP